MHRVVIADFVHDELEPELSVLQGLAQVDALNAHSEKELIGRIEDADAVILYHHISITEETIPRLTRCKLIVRAGVGYDNVDTDCARRCGIPVANVPDYGSEEVADTALAMTLALTRGVHLLNSRLRAGTGPWSYRQTVPLVRLRGRVFGIVGLGRIGTAAALRAKSLGMDVCFYDPLKPDGYDKSLGVRRVERLEDLLEQVLVLSVHCPLTEETRLMIGREAIERMPRGSYLINTARGAIVDTHYLPEAIASGHLAGAGIDVLETEPPPDDHPLVAAWRNPEHPAHERLLLNPHAAFYCEEGFREMRTKTAEACRRALAGEPLRNIVN